jgi:hypothetical protein
MVGVFDKEELGLSHRGKAAPPGSPPYLGYGNGFPYPLGLQLEGGAENGACTFFHATLFAGGIQVIQGFFQGRNEGVQL